MKLLKILKRAFDYYSSIRVELGIKFINALEEYIIEISKHPLHFQIKNFTYREAVIKNFPYIVVYEFFEEKEVVVYAVFCTYRNPENKPK